MYYVNILAADALVFYHQGISSHNVVQYLILHSQILSCQWVKVHPLWTHDSI